jgi:DNA-directed RNA polymerase specialized sigma24 family protein
MALRKRKEDLLVKVLDHDWEEVLSGDEELFREMTESHLPALTEAARTGLRQQIRFGNIGPDTVLPEEVVSETLIRAWQVRHGYSEHRPFLDWLLEVEKQTLQRLVDEERRLQEIMPVSLESPAAPAQASDDENEYWEWVEPQPRDRWEDVIPDETAQPLAA